MTEAKALNVSLSHGAEYGLRSADVVIAGQRKAENVAARQSSVE